VSVSLGLLEVGAYGAMLPVHKLWDVRLVHLITNTVPWIYVMVMDPRRNPSTMIT
jgi:hypothetical protein